MNNCLLNILIAFFALKVVNGDQRIYLTNSEFAQLNSGQPLYKENDLELFSCHIWTKDKGFMNADDNQSCIDEVSEEGMILSKDSICCNGICVQAETCDYQIYNSVYNVEINNEIFSCKKEGIFSNSY